MARVRPLGLPSINDMPAMLREYSPKDWPPPIDRAEAMAQTFGRARMVAIVSRSMWSAARREWLASHGLRTMRDLAPGEGS